MEFNGRVDSYKNELDKTYNGVSVAQEKAVYDNNIEMMELCANSLNTLKYEIDNPEASYICSAIRFINSAVYYPYPNTNFNNELLANKLNVDIKEIENLHSLSLKNDKEEYRQALIELIGIPVKIPTLAETKEIFKNIIESEELTPEEKQEQIFKYEMLTGFERGIYSYYGQSGPDKPMLYNEQGMKMSEMFHGSYDIVYENGLEKEMTL